MPGQRVAVVTGANRGIGRAVAAQLAERGLLVFVAGRDEGAVREAADDLGAGTRPLILDVTSQASVDWAVAATGHVDVLVNNAAILDEGQDPLVEDGGRIEQLIDTNLLGAWRATRGFAPGMIERGWGRIVNVSSGAGSFSAGLWTAAPAYSVSKAALNALTVVLDARLRGTGVKVNAADPGTVATRMAPYAGRTPEQAAGPIADLALLPDDGPSGGFFHEGAPEPW
jgi:NAD(P)-dependent dehydrogenase (short-subunit alcohol dehydrogenase family)